MKTKDFIKMLQEADPSGESHIRMEGGIPYHAELKEGYWDGPYAFIDDKGNYVYTIADCKVDIYCRDVEDFVSEHIDIHNENNWEEIKSKFKFNLTGYSVKSQRQEREDGVIKQAHKIFVELTELHKKMFAQSTDQAINRYKSGWKFFQDKQVDKGERPNFYYYYHWLIINENGGKGSSSIQDTEGILKSGLFERLDNNKQEGYYEWVLKE